MGFVIPAAAFLAAKIGKSYFNSRSKKKANTEQKRADVSALTTQQKQGEDSRRARVQAAGSLLNGVPSTTAGGGVNTNVGLDPALLASLGAERTYDFASGIPDRNKGAGSALIAGLFGDVGDTIATAYGGGAMGAAGSALAGGAHTANANNLSSFVGNDAAGGGGGLSFEELQKLINSGAGGGS